MHFCSVGLGSVPGGNFCNHRVLFNPGVRAFGRVLLDVGFLWDLFGGYLDTRDLLA